jgi:hypothetical protein
LYLFDLDLLEFFTPKKTPTSYIFSNVHKICVFQKTYTMIFVVATRPVFFPWGPWGTFLASKFTRLEW